ncbi:hypothetical protein BD309DRAFT_865046 [Dichomitus squalens]|uniref:Uncharacterized protein n=1 Tax=Dichomitus squalens TaxID=114155 RepID=A0A4Q9NUA2_9APHY|nr:hypothetical protein BD309DRAFT_865046 [Dichomitus squalens]TBU53162.1 hypothetical protein BD310DRAFT_830667 [Dichomitus squalens]
MASHLLTQSLSALPSATSPTLLQGEDPKGKGRAVSSSYPSTSSAAAEHPRGEGEGEKDAVPTPPPRRAHATRLATGALSTPPNAYKEPSLRSAAAGGSGLGDTEHASGGTADGKSKDKAKAETGAGSPAVLSVLKDCRIFVDVRSEEGDDAGSLFVDMLRNMGAKIAARVGSRCTHVVFKNGLMSTLKGYRMLSDPKPHVVGIGWVVACAEQRRRVEETQFPVNLNLANVAGVNKRRKSVIPKTYSPMANKIATSPASSDSSRIDNVLNTSLGAASRSLEVSSPGVVNEESLPPLEMARRRRSMMPS